MDTSCNQYQIRDNNKVTGIDHINKRKPFRLNIYTTLNMNLYYLKEYYESLERLFKNYGISHIENYK